MRPIAILATLLAASALASPSTAYGQSDLVGKKAGNFSAGTMVNEVDDKSLEACAGEVILVKYWGTK